MPYKDVKLSLRIKFNESSQVSIRNMIIVVVMIIVFIQKYVILKSGLAVIV